MKKKNVRIFPCNFPEELLVAARVAYSRDLFTDEFYVENPPKHLLDFLTTLILDDFQDKEYHEFDNHDGSFGSSIVESLIVERDLKCV